VGPSAPPGQHDLCLQGICRDAPLRGPSLARFGDGAALATCGECSGSGTLECVTHCRVLDSHLRGRRADGGQRAAGRPQRFLDQWRGFCRRCPCCGPVYVWVVPCVRGDCRLPCSLSPRKLPGLASVSGSPRWRAALGRGRKWRDGYAGTGTVQGWLRRRDDRFDMVIPLQGGWGGLACSLGTGSGCIARA